MVSCKKCGAFIHGGELPRYLDKISCPRCGAIVSLPTAAKVLPPAKTGKLSRRDAVKAVKKAMKKLEEGDLK